MAVSITHAHQTAIPDDPAYDVGADEWNAAHTITGLNAAAVPFTPAGNIAATDTQAAIEELDTEKQPLDADLTSWAGVTRASGFDTFAATPSSANLKSLVSDETGSGALVFGTSPTITTNLTLTAAGNASMEIGRTDGNASTPFLDFHSGATAVDHDARLIASGGDGTARGGVLTAQGTFAIQPRAASTKAGLQVTQTPAGSPLAQTNLNSFTITDTLDADTGEVHGLYLEHNFGSSVAKGARTPLYSFLNFQEATSATNANRNYTAGVFVAQAADDDNGTGGSPAGALFALNPVTRLIDAAATNWLNISGGEVNIGVVAGASVSYKSGWAIVPFGSDAVQGTDYDAALAFSAQGGAVGWKDLILVGAMNGQYPGAATGNIFRTIGGTSNNGIDLSNTTITTSAFKSNGFDVSGSGVVTAPKVIGGTGTTSTLTLQPTSGNGTTGSDIIFQVGNNGATEAWRADSSGNFLKGTTTAIAVRNIINAGAVTPPVQVLAGNNYLAVRFNAAAVGPTSYFAKSRGTTSTDFAVVQVDDELGNFAFEGSDGTIFRVAAAFGAKVDGTPGSNDMPGRIYFSTTPDGSGTVVERWNIDNAGTLKPATNDGAAIGTTALGVSDLFLASGAVIKCANDESITHAADTFTVGGASWKLASGTTTIAPLLYQSGTNLTSAVAGGVEFDGVQYYQTIDTTSGRAAIPAEQYFHLTADGSTISTIANFFGATSNIAIVASGYYVIDIHMWYLNTTAGTVTWTLTNSAAPTSQNIYYEMSPITGIVAPPGTATMLVGQTTKDATAALAYTTGTLTTAVEHYAHFKVWLQNGTGTSLKIQATKNVGGTITPRLNSYWTCRRMSPNNIGTFVA